MYSKEDIASLLSILLESKHFEIEEFGGSRLVASFNCYGNASRNEDGVHGFATEAFRELFTSVCEYDSRISPRCLVVVKQKKYNDLAARAIAHYLISLQNHLHYQKHGQPHPSSAKGATYSSNLTKPISELLPDCDLFLERNEAGIIRINIANQELKQGFINDFCKPPLGKNQNGIELYKSSADAVFLSSSNFSWLLKILEERRINYQGIIPVTKNGEILMAQRKDNFTIDAQGYATCGGHHSDPYHFVGLASDFFDEFNLKLKPDSGLNEAFTLLAQNGDFAIYLITEDHFDISGFKPNKKEFLEKSGESFSFAEMRKRRLALRNIDSIEYYLDFCQHEVEKRIAKKFPDIEVLVAVNKTTRIDERANLRFVCDDFGKIEFACRDEVNFVNLLELFKQELGEFIEVDTENYKIVFSVLNPQQLIDFFDGKLSQENLKQYFDLQKEKDLQNTAASKIQKWVRPKLAKMAVKRGKTKIDIEAKSAENLAKLRADLQQGKFLSEEERSKKDPESPLTHEEQELFQALKSIPLFLFHSSKLREITNLHQFGLLSALELKKLGLIESNIITEDDKTGISRQVCFAIGSIDNLNGFVHQERPTLVRIDYDRALENFPKSWGGEDWYFYFSPPEEVDTEVSIGNHSYEVVYEDEEDVGLKKRHVVNKKHTVHWDYRDLGDDVFCAKDARDFLALMFIYRLRFIDGSARKYLLKNPSDEKAVAMIFDKLFNNFNLEYHILAKVDLSANLDAKIFDAKEALNIAQELEEAARTQNIKALHELASKHSDLAYQYEFASRFRGFQVDIGRAVLQSESLRVAQFFIEQGFFDKMVTSYKLEDKESKPMKDFVAIFNKFRPSNAKQAFFDAEIVSEAILEDFREKRVAKPKSFKFLGSKHQAQPSFE